MAKKENKNYPWCCCYVSSRLFWALLILFIGLWLFAKDIGLISVRISIWPIILIIFGVWLLVKRKKTC